MMRGFRSLDRFDLLVAGVVGVVLTVLTVSPSEAACYNNSQMAHCATVERPKTYTIRNSWEQGQIKVGDIYDPGHGRPLQIRNNQRQIIGTIDRAVPRDEWEEYYE